VAQLLLLVIFVPFLIAQAMPNKKWLLAYLLAFSTATILGYYALGESIHQTTSNGKDLPGHGIGEGLILLVLFVSSISGISGIISKAIFFYLNARYFPVPKWFNLLVGMGSIALTSILSIVILQGLATVPIKTFSR
jgi:hypothetical protein